MRPEELKAGGMAAPAEKLKADGLGTPAEKLKAQSLGAAGQSSPEGRGNAKPAAAASGDTAAPDTGAPRTLLPGA
ncbi:5-(carboxyamino)imidazole ribonucleotide synthase, partial [Paenibacillus graminis]|nr:5-(carboxyamino)imidazole ribonucleotide synthase [Paenibacillus graminis]